MYIYSKMELELVCAEVVEVVFGEVEFSGELRKVEVTAIYYVERNLVFVFEGKVGKFVLPCVSLPTSYYVERILVFVFAGKVA